MNPFYCFKDFTYFGTFMFLGNRLTLNFIHLIMRTILSIRSKLSSILLKLLSLFKKPFIKMFFVEEIMMREWILCWCYSIKKTYEIYFVHPRFKREKNVSHAINTIIIVQMFPPLTLAPLELCSNPL